MSGAEKRIAAFGECMIEISDLGDGGAERRFGGDSLNTAVYLARLGARSGLRVRYLTALGDDPWSDAMIAEWRSEGIDTELVARLPGALPGLYMIRTDPAGERSFHYWRQNAAARRFWRATDGEALRAALRDCALVYLSGISLSITPEADRERLYEALADARAAGAMIAFDGNYRPRGWPDPAAARAAFDRLYPLVDLALPTFEDEKALYGDGDVAACQARLRAHGVGEIAVKLGAEGASVLAGGEPEHVPGERDVAVRDTTAAGDSFNAAYLAARLAGAAPAEAVRAGHRLAARVIGHRGAIMPREAMADML